ncbi:hypothetical protein [Nocardioides convexus]|uniref:hypothetical protein n=1 Tax=Nocardioides convexus TaxID=2712224 RepID=UPI0024182357|nr:hypothetical protein [Nocardioides convexus]
MPLFRRVGRGVVPTTAADTFRPHAERVLAAADDAQRAVASIKSLETGTIRFGMFGVARLYGGAGLVADVLERYPGVRVEPGRAALPRGAGQPAAWAPGSGHDRRRRPVQRGPDDHADRSRRVSSTSRPTPSGWARR